MRNPSYHDFARVPSVAIPRSAFDMSSRYKTAFDSGKVVPVMSPLEIIPGDSINLSLSAFARLTTPIVPFMDNLVLDFHFFFVPSRLVWSNFQKFMGEQENPGDSIDYQVPQLNSGNDGFAIGSLADYFGIPTGISNLSVNALPFRAYNLIWNEWYRPELLANSRTVDKDDGPDTLTDYLDLAPRYNRLDYFQGATPSPQKGDAVTLGVGGNAPVRYGVNPFLSGKSVPVHEAEYFAVSTARNGVGGTLKDNGATGTVDGKQVWVRNVGFDTTNPTDFGYVDGSGNLWSVARSATANVGNGASPLYADLSEATSATINQLRQAFQVQLFLERENLGGSRYTEILRSMFGVISPDARLQRPEYLGGGSIPIVISSVPQTSSTDNQTPQGNLAAFGLTKGRLPHIKKSFTEHGYVFAFCSVRAPVTYQQGLDRMWSRKTRFDFYWPVFAHLGEQAILNKEIYAQGGSVTDDDGNVVDDSVFGYQERYAEYRYGVSRVTGHLRSTSSTPLDVWHLGIKYDSLPQLGDTFAQVNIPLSRVLAITDQPQFVYDSLINIKMYRPMPLYGQPGRIDHFF